MGNHLKNCALGGAGWFLRRGALLYLTCALLSWDSGTMAQTNAVPFGPRPPRLSPDYTDITIPPNIAPLNFVLKEPPGRYRVRLYGQRGKPIEIRTTNQRVQYPEKAWHELLKANAGGAVYFDIRLEDAKSPPPFTTITNQIATEPIDPYLVYRLIRPLYNLYINVGIYQRDLSSFKESEVLRNDRFEQGCLNCHAFLQNNPQVMAFHARTKRFGQPLLIHQGRETAHVAKPMGYLAWHPAGKFLAFSNNRLSLLFHTTGENRDVFDSASDIGLYDIDANTIQMPAATADPQRQETWPAWSPDGFYLYFCSAPKLERKDFKRVQYDLERVRFDPQTRTWGPPETLVAAAQTHLSAAQPRVSPDGRYLIFCLAPYGSFPIYQSQSDLYLLDLQSRQYHRMALNSDRADTWHCWSSNGRWIVFSSKRRDGLFARPHFSYFGAQGRESKPFILPQKNPEFYDSFIQTYNLPELVTGPVTVAPRDLAQAIVAPAIKLAPQTPTQPSAQSAETQEPSRTENEQ
jgi:hypothetical protein